MDDDVDQLVHVRDVAGDDVDAVNSSSSAMEGVAVSAGIPEAVADLEVED